MIEYRVIEKDYPILGKCITKEEAKQIMAINERLFNEKMNGKTIDASMIKVVCIRRE